MNTHPIDWTPIVTGLVTASVLPIARHSGLLAGLLGLPRIRGVFVPDIRMATGTFAMIQRLALDPIGL